MKDFVYVYILVSQANAAVHYNGITRDLEQRLLEHNRRNVRRPRNTGHGESKPLLRSNL
jgi:predicted GIY-YIG superfamily endonuclease